MIYNMSVLLTLHYVCSLFEQDAKQVDLTVVSMSVRPEKLTASAFVCKVLLTFSSSDETKQKESILEG